MGQTAQVANPYGTAAFDATASCDLSPVRESLMDFIPQPRGSEEGMRLVVSRGPDRGTEYVIKGTLTVIGRHRDCDIRVDDVTASRYHAELEVYNGRCVLSDGGSLNGTYVNRRPVECVELSEGDEIWIGTARFIFRTAAA